MAEVGPPSKLTNEARVKIKEVAAMDGTVEEMAYYSGVSRQTIYNWFKEEPELFDEVERLRQKPILKARTTITNSLGDPEMAMKYLTKKRRKEFGDKIEVETNLTISQVLDNLDGSKTEGQKLEDQPPL